MQNADSRWIQYLSVTPKWLFPMGPIFHAGPSGPQPYTNIFFTYTLYLKMDSMVSRENAPTWNSSSTKNN